jgi:hypothetical protein
MAFLCSLGLHDAGVHIHTVNEENYSFESEKIHDIMRSNFNVIGLQVTSAVDQYFFARY